MYMYARLNICSNNESYNDILTIQDKQPNKGALCGLSITMIVMILHIDGLEQEKRNSSALVMGLRLFCTSPSIWHSITRCLLYAPSWKYIEAQIIVILN